VNRLVEILRRDVNVDLRRGLPLVLVAVAVFLHTLIGDAKTWSPALFGTALIQRGGLIAVEILLSAAILVALRRILSPRGKKLDVVGCALATLLAFGQPALHLFTSAMMDEMADVSVFDHEDERWEKLGRTALTGSNPKARELGARLIYEDSGQRIPYKDAQDVVRPYEPTPAEVTKREERRTQVSSLATTRATLRTFAAHLRWMVYADLAVLAAMLVPGFVIIGLERRRA
jgi:hypothetical protein